MIKYYALILLASFAVGISQPVVPMVNYHLNQGNIADFLFSNHSEHEGHNICNLCDCGESLPVNQLLNLDYYPVPVLNSSVQTAAILPHLSGHYNFINQAWKSHFSMPASPPPKHIRQKK
jgi:hypothetical protein